MSPEGEVTRVAVVFPEGRGVARWEERNAESPVPGRWPYGLDLVGGSGVEVVPLEVAPLSTPRRMLASFGPVNRVRRSTGSRRDHDVAICWDETTALAMHDRVAARRHLSGVIWITDAVARGDRGRHVREVRGVLRRMDALWVLSRPQVERVIDWLGPGAPPVHFVPFGIDVDFYRATPYPRRPLVASVGGDRDRDTKTLYDALSLVRKRRPDVRCVVQSATDVAVPEGVERLRFIPHAQVSRLFAQASVVAVATKPNWHVSGMTVSLEAGACARPVVACDTPGMRDYVRPGATGELVAPGDASEMAERILGLLDGPAAAARMGRNARSVVEEHHSTASMCRSLRALVQPPQSHEG